MTTFLRHRLWPAIALLLALTIVTGFLYPLVVTAVAQVAFPSQANGSFIQTADGRTIGSSLIGQAFSQPKYFWSRPSAAGVTDANPGGYDGSASAGSNLGPTNQKLIERDHGRGRRAAGGQRRQADPGRPRDDVGLGARSGHQPGRGRVPGRARRQGARHVRGRTSGRSSPATPSSRSSASSASRGSTSCSSTSTSTACCRTM